MTIATPPKTFDSVDIIEYISSLLNIEPHDLAAKTPIKEKSESESAREKKYFIGHFTSAQSKDKPMVICRSPYDDRSFVLAENEELSAQKGKTACLVEIYHTAQNGRSRWANVICTIEPVNFPEVETFFNNVWNFSSPQRPYVAPHKQFPKLFSRVKQINVAAQTSTQSQNFYESADVSGTFADNWPQN